MIRSSAAAEPDIMSPGTGPETRASRPGHGSVRVPGKGLRIPKAGPFIHFTGI